VRARDYLRQVLSTLDSNPIIVSYDVEFDVKSSTLILLHGTILFKDGSTLEFLELVKETDKGLERLKYRFQYTKGSKLIFRYDNAPHHREIETFPHHKHVGNTVLPSKEKNLLEVLKEVEGTIQ
jgi:hypothetical protein